jgi:hypothetical protein
MEDKRITAEQLMEAWQAEYRVLAEQTAKAMNEAKAGRIIADTEEPVRDAHAEFRQKAYQTSLGLLAEQCGPEAFPPSASRGREAVEE